MRKVVCVFLSVMIIGITGCGPQPKETVETESIQATAAVEVLEPETENLQIAEVEESVPSNNSGENSHDYITQEEFESFKVTADAIDAEGFYKFDDFADVMKQDFTGTWYDPGYGESIRLTDEYAYVYIPYLEEYGDVPYEWELIDRSDRNLCPMLEIYMWGREQGGLAYYVAGFRGDYFWCNSQTQLFYRQ